MNPLRDRATQMRLQGKTYSEIKNVLKISKGTLSSWFHKFELSSLALERLARKQAKMLHLARKRAIYMSKERKKLTQADLDRKIYDYFSAFEINDFVLKLALSFLYIGEGAKWKSHRGLQLGSSDPIILKLYIRLLKKCYAIDKDKLSCYISYRADQDLNSLKRYWSKNLGISLARFHETKHDPRTVGKPTKNRKYRGVCIISCAGTLIQRELEMIPEKLLDGPLAQG